MTRILTVITLLLLPTIARAEEKPKPVDKTRGPAVTYAIQQQYDVPYAKEPRQRLDVFAPREARTRFPVVLFVHGGSWMWMVGDKNFFGIYRNAGKNLARNGVVTVMPNYRLSPFVRHPEHVKDIARVYAWILKNIHRYGGDPNRIILAGHSSGAHLAALLATDARYLKDPTLKLTDTQRKSLRGVVSISGVYRLPKQKEFKDMLAIAINGMVGDSRESGLAMSFGPMLVYLGETLNPFPWVFGKESDVWKQASPLSHVRKELPPFLVLTAVFELPRLKVMADEFSSALKKHGNVVVRRNQTGCSHHTIVNKLHANNNDMCRLVLEFIAKHAGKAEKATR